MREHKPILSVVGGQGVRITNARRSRANNPTGAVPLARLVRSGKKATTMTNETVQNSVECISQVKALLLEAMSEALKKAEGGEDVAADFEQAKLALAELKASVHQLIYNIEGNLSEVIGFMQLTNAITAASDYLDCAMAAQQCVSHYATMSPLYASFRSRAIDFFGSAVHALSGR